MTTQLRRLVREEDGTCMTDSRGMYGWTIAVVACAWILWGHRLPEAIAFLDQALPGSHHYSVR